MSEDAPRGFDTARFKRIEQAGYDLIAGRYAQTEHTRAALRVALLEAGQLSPGLRVLDLASGPGTLAADAAQRVAPNGWVCASDLSLGMMRCCAAGERSIGRVAADAERLPFAPGSFERLLCGLGLMFFPDAERALREMGRVLVPGGRLALSVWGPESEVPLVACALACMRRVLPAPKVARPSVFRFGNPETLAALLAKAGLRDTRIDDVMLDVSFADPAAYWQGFLDLAGGAAWSLSQLAPGLRERLREEVARELEPYAGASGYRLPSRVLVASASR